MAKPEGFKPIPKRILEKRVRDGVWLEVWWNDAPNSFVLVAHGASIDWRSRGGVTIDCWETDSKGNFTKRGTYIIHDQIVRVGPRIKIPTLEDFLPDDPVKYPTLDRNVSEKLS